MPDTGFIPDAGPPPREDSRRLVRGPFIAFVTDAASQKVLSDGLADVMPNGLDIRRGGVRAAIAAMQKLASPRVLLVDITGEDQPLSALTQLSYVVEPDVAVLVIGDVDQVDFYREITHGLGALDYLTKPLTNDKVARYFGPLVAGQSHRPVDVQTGSLVTITGVHGGVGATTLAVNLAGYFGVTARRHTILLDPDLYLGDAAFLLNVQPGPGLRMALETPERIDGLLAERAAQPAAERLHILSGEESLANPLAYTPGAMESLLAALRSRYSFIVADVPFRQAPEYADLLRLAQQQVFVMTPTLTCVRATLRLLALTANLPQAPHPVIVLNRLGCPGGLTRRQIEDALAVKVDVVIHDLPRDVVEAATMGEIAALRHGRFRDGVTELARRVAFVGLLDSTTGPEPVQATRNGWRAWRLFRRDP